MFRMMMALFFVLLGLVVGPTEVGAQAAIQRHALVIGNDNYQYVERLQNSRSDARAVASVLEQSGFRVSVHIDLDLSALKGALRTFKAQVNAGDEAVFFFAGHGVEIDGVSYLMPTDIKDESSDQVKDDSVPLNRVLDDLREKRARFSLAIIDACRNNPFQSKGRSIGGSRGLAAPPVVTGQMVLYSAGAGQLALDTLGPGDPVRNGVFTRVLLREMARPGVEVGEVMRSVREEVAALAKSVGREQVPALYDQRLGRFFFRAPVAAAVPTAPQVQVPVVQSPGIDPESRFWDSAQRIDNRAAYEAYLAEYPRGRYAALARAAIARFEVGDAGYTTTAQLAPQLTQQPFATAPAPAHRAVIPTPGTVFRDCDDCPEMVVIPGGAFLMGSPEGEGDTDERPQRWVQVDAFSVGRFEVMRAEYRAFAEATGRNDKDCAAWNGKEWVKDAARNWKYPGYVQDDGHPVACVSWEDAKAYTAWLSMRTGKTYRLLTEAEWEYAVRAGTVTRRFWGDDGNQSCEYANTADRNAKRTSLVVPDTASADCDDEHAYTASVGRYQANGFGLYDMLGNVWEWVEDCWNETYAGAPTDGRAWTQGECGRRVLRGGSWLNIPGHVRAAYRFWGTTGYRLNYAGLRVARSE
jgi:formylglycine-generating enzyme required for sulfatase activity